MSRPGNPRRQYQRPPPFDASGNEASPRFRNELGRPAGAALTQPPLHTPRSLDQERPGREDRDCGHTFQDSGLWQGDYWPYRVPLPFKLLAGNVQDFRLAYPGRMQVTVTVSTGIASFFYFPANPVTDQYHFQVAPSPQPFQFFLPPGAHRMAVLADNNQACTLTLFVVGLPPERWDPTGHSP